MTERTQPQPENGQAKRGPLRGLDLARRFDIIAAPGRRVLQGRIVPLRRILIVLGIITVGIVANALWLTFQPNPGPAATLAALNQAEFERAFATATPTPSVPPPTEAPTPTDIPTPKPTNTLVPLPTGRPKRTPTPEPPSSPTPIPAPRLVAPSDGVTALETMDFEWAWDGSPLKENQAFDLRVWSLQEEQMGSPRRGVVPPTKDTRVTVSLAAVPAIMDYGPGDYLWTVVVVEVPADGSPVVVVGTWGQVWRLVYP